MPWDERFQRRDDASDTTYTHKDHFRAQAPFLFLDFLPFRAQQTHICLLHGVLCIDVGSSSPLILGWPLFVCLGIGKGLIDQLFRHLQGFGTPEAWRDPFCCCNSSYWISYYRHGFFFPLSRDSVARFLADGWGGWLVFGGERKGVGPSIK